MRGRTIFLVLIFTTFSLSLQACSSGSFLFFGHSPDVDSTSYPNQVELTDPGKNYVETTVYLESMRKITYEGKPAILIYGNFPNGCAQLLKADHSVTNVNTLVLHLQGWQPKDALCTQALVPFTFVYTEIDEETIQKLGYFEIDGELNNFDTSQSQ